MNFELPPIGGADGLTPPQRPQGSERGDFGSALSKAMGLPATPPSEVLDQMGTAAAVADRLAAQGRELHFELSGPGQVSVQLRDRGGNVLRAVPPSEALDIATGTREV